MNSDFRVIHCHIEIVWSELNKSVIKSNSIERKNKKCNWGAETSSGSRKLENALHSSFRMFRFPIERMKNLKNLQQIINHNILCNHSNKLFIIYFKLYFLFHHDRNHSVSRLTCAREFLRFLYARRRRIWCLVRISE